MGTFTNREDRDEMPHFAAINLGLHLCKSKRDIQTKNTIFFLNYNLTPLDIFNGLAQVYCIKPEGRIRKYTKG